MIKDKWLLIVNPMAGGTRLGKQWAKMSKQLQEAGLSFDAVLTKDKGHAMVLVQEGLEKGYRNFAGVGGDGTNNEIINGILQHFNGRPENIKYTLLPFGTGNDWARTHKISKKPIEWVNMINTGQIIKHSVGHLILGKQGQAIERYFINIAGMVYDAHVVKEGEKYSSKSRVKLLYLWLVLKCLWSFKAPKLKIKFQDQERIDKYYTINCGVCNYAGGGMKIIPRANPISDSFGLTMIKDFPKWRVPFDTPKLFNGKLENHKYTELAKCKTLRVEALDEHELQIETDGEYLGTGVVEIKILPNYLDVIIPR